MTELPFAGYEALYLRALVAPEVVVAALERRGIPKERALRTLDELDVERARFDQARTAGTSAAPEYRAWMPGAFWPRVIGASEPSSLEPNLRALGYPADLAGALVGLAAAMGAELRAAVASRRR